MSDTIYSFDFTDNQGNVRQLSEFAGKAILIVNTASKCGFTPQYDELESLYQQNKERLVIIAFPCDQFGHQEPGNNEEIAQFCQLRFGVSFPLANKIDVNGDNTPPLYQFLKSHAKGLLGTQSIKWNFTKFLISPTGQVVSRYAPSTKPSAIANDIEQLFN